MKRILALFSVLNKGEELANAATWKNRQTLINVLVSFLGALVIFLPLMGVDIAVDQEDILAIAGGIAAVAGIVNGLLTNATSKKVGLPPSGDRFPDNARF